MPSRLTKGYIESIQGGASLPTDYKLDRDELAVRLLDSDLTSMRYHAREAGRQALHFRPLRAIKHTYYFFLQWSHARTKRRALLERGVGFITIPPKKR